MLFTVISICVSLYEEGLFSLEPIHFLGLQLTHFLRKKVAFKTTKSFLENQSAAFKCWMFSFFQMEFIYLPKKNEYTWRIHEYAPQATV